MKSTLAASLVFVLSLSTAVTANAWVAEELDWPEPSGGGVSASSSIVIDSTGAIHIRSQNRDLGALQCSRNASASWVTNVLDGVGDTGYGSSFVVNSVGSIRMSHQGQDGTLLLPVIGFVSLFVQSSIATSSFCTGLRS